MSCAAAPKLVPKLLPAPSANKPHHHLGRLHSHRICTCRASTHWARALRLNERDPPVHLFHVSDGADAPENVAALTGNGCVSSGLRTAPTSQESTPPKLRLLPRPCCPSTFSCFLASRQFAELLLPVNTAPLWQDSCCSGSLVPFMWSTILLRPAASGTRLHNWAEALKIIACDGYAYRCGPWTT